MAKPCEVTITIRSVPGNSGENVIVTAGTETPGEFHELLNSIIQGNRDVPMAIVAAGHMLSAWMKKARRDGAKPVTGHPERLN
jgi:hypothetical protein